MMLVTMVLVGALAKLEVFDGPFDLVDPLAELEFAIGLLRLERPAFSLALLGLGYGGNADE